ncbi:MAG TPA: hypothetical protein VK866_09925 [Acidimicrobiales bacterium]|nr:hypothetical protein [Acidimicrobiales bacterium]
MRTPSRSRPRSRTGLVIAVIAVLALAAAGCGDDDDTATGPGDTDPATTISAPGGGLVTLDADLTITAGTSDAPDAEGTATLSCSQGDGGDGEAADGTGWFEDAAGEACAALSDEAVLAALASPPADQVCAEVYGGPSVATITGTVAGEPIDAELDRTDACGIDRWDSLQSLLPEPVEPE